MNESLKYCAKCERWKIITEFYKDKTYSDGLSFYCKNCIKKGRRAYRKTRKYKEWAQEYYKRKDVKEKRKERDRKRYSSSRRQDWRKQYCQSPEYKERQREYRKSEKYKRWYYEYTHRPEVRERMREANRRYYRKLTPEKRKEFQRKKREYMAEYRSRPEIKRRQAKYMREYVIRSEVRERLKKYHHIYHKKFYSQYYDQYKMRPEVRTRWRKRDHDRRCREVNAPGNHTDKEWNKLCDLAGHKCTYCGSDELLTKDHIIALTNGGCDCIHNIQPLCGKCNSGKCNYHSIDYRSPEVIDWLSTLPTTNYRCNLHS